MKVRTAIRTATMGSSWLRGNGQFLDSYAALQSSADTLTTYLSQPKFTVFAPDANGNIAPVVGAADSIDDLLRRTKESISGRARSRLNRYMLIRRTAAAAAMSIPSSIRKM